MRILFYLPVITPWWFARIVQPVMARLAATHEVHVLAPPPWRNTGIGADEIALCTDLPDICWHIVKDADHTSMRTEPKERDAIAAFVRSLDPDFTICRSADFETPTQFPGIVRHITEGAADPLKLGADCFHFTQTPFDHGVLPDLAADEIAKLDAMIAPYWPAMQRSARLDQVQRDYLNEWAALPADRPVIFLPLEYEHEENFYSIHRPGPVANAGFLQQISDQIGDRAFLALTNHPLNEKHLDNSAVRQVVRANPSRMRLLPGKTPLGTRSSQYLMKAADGLIVGDSKVYAMAGFLSTPMLRLSRFATGGWMHAARDMERFIADLQNASAEAPDTKRAQTWFAYHVANNLMCPRNPDLTAQTILKRLERPCDSARWQSNFDYFAQEWAHDLAGEPESALV